MGANESYKNLLERTRQIALINSTSSLLSWDQETYMPEQAVQYRSEQLAFLSGQSHRLFTAEDVDGWLKDCEDQNFEAGSTQAVNVREWRRSYDRATKLPSDLVEDISKTTALGRSVWVQARKNKKFSEFREALQKIVQLNLQCAEYWGYEDSPYDALLEEYEAGARSKELQKLFAELGPKQSEIVKELTEKSQKMPEDMLLGDYPVEKQQAFNRRVAEAFGFDFEQGRIDTTTHPFCTELGPNDCRLTTRYNIKDFTQSLYGVLHEAGHGMYEQGLPDEDFGTPCGDSVSLGIHESQSRLWENKVGRAKEFWEYWHPIACEYFPNLAKLSASQITAAVNRVQPSFIRVEADDVTYDLHILLRFKIELEVIEGRLRVDDIPAFWNESFKELFGLDVPDDSNGCLQDIHWSLGSFGYFPTYSLGNLNAAQLYHKALDQSSSILGELQKGQYETLLKWLQKNIHEHGKRLLAPALIEKATGAKLSIEPHLEDLKAKSELIG